MNSLILTLALHYSFCNDLYLDLVNTKPSEENLAVCSLLLEDAIKLDASIEDILAIGWVESWFTGQLKPTRYNCFGPLQIKIQYWCKGKKLSTCDPYYDGVKALQYYIKKFKPLNKAFCYYNNSKKRKCKAKYNYKTDYVVDALAAKKKIRKLLNSKKYQHIKNQ